jgi:hypothetical protein
MSARMLGTILLLIASEALGVCYGEWSYKLFVKMIPPVALTEFNNGAAHVTLLGSGVVLGLAIFVLVLVATWFAGMSKPRPASQAAPPVQPTPTH